ncbi:MAG TPA: hypothetical protein VMH87_12305 [Pseudomonadales bacterium]|nr:hypothetical protein [Pseudomonadales bacterium]
MPIELQLIRASEFIRLDSDEHIDFEASKRVLQDLAHACRKRGLDRAMLDIRSIPVPDKPRFTPTELAALAGAFREAGFTRQQRLAILYKHDIYGGVRNFTFFSKLRGLQVQAFHDFETAFYWLAEENPAVKEYGAEVPILAHGSKKRTENLTVAIQRTPAPRPVRRTKGNL